MNDLSTFQLVIVAVIGIIAAASTGLLLLIGVVHLKEKYWPVPPAQSRGWHPKAGMRRFGGNSRIISSHNLPIDRT